MRHSCVLVVGIICVIISSAFGSYDAYASSHDDDDDYEPSYAAPPIVHPHHGHSAGSYYHYHVPLVGQQQQQQHHYQPYHHHQQDHSHFLWPLLLLLALPLLFLPLLPLLLLPLGLSLLALLMPGGMMMMMMMMMMGGGMMMRTDTVSAGRALNEMRTFGDVIFKDLTSLVSKYARSLDLDQCPQRIACEAGMIFSPENNSTDTGTAKAFTNLIMDQYIPKGKIKRAIKQFEKAFWNGYSQGKCEVFQCQPTFRVYKNPGQDESVQTGSISGPMTSSSSQAQFNESQSLPVEIKENFINYVYPSSTSNANGNGDASIYQTQTSTENPKSKSKRSHISRYGTISRKVQRNEIPYSNDKYFDMLGTPTVKS